MRKKILLADDFEPIRHAIRALLSSKTEWNISEAVDGMDALEKAKASCPDLAILDVSMPRMGGIAAAHVILEYCPFTLLLVSSLHDSVALMEEIKGNGIRGFVPKSDLAERLIPAIETILSGGTYFPEINL